MGRLGRRLRRAAAAVAVAAAAAAALGGDDAAERYAKPRLARLEKAAAARLWQAADRAAEQKLHGAARAQARRVLELDPDHREARALLGFARRGSEWVEDPALAARTPATDEAPAEALRAWRATARRCDAEVAVMYVALGDDLAARGHVEHARAVRTKALEFDPDNEAARKALGFVRYRGQWLTDAKARALRDAAAVRPLDEASAYDKACGVRLSKAASAHFRVESPHSGERIASYLGACEAAYATWLADLGRDPTESVLPQVPVFCVLADDAQWDGYLGAVAQARSREFYRKQVCYWARDRWTAAIREWEGSTDERRRDRLAHQTAHMLGLAVFDLPDGSWLDEALADRCAILVHGSTATYCVAPKAEDYAPAGGEAREWTDQEKWKEHLRELAAKRDDLPLRTIVLKRFYDLPMHASVKAWSVVSWLVETDRARFAALLAKVKGAKDQAALVEGHYGRGLEALDDEWRAWVLATY